VRGITTIHSRAGKTKFPTEIFKTKGKKRKRRKTRKKKVCVVVVLLFMTRVKVAQISSLFFTPSLMS
jgi:hypothetical protein